MYTYICIAHDAYVHLHAGIHGSMQQRVTLSGERNTEH